jgi:phosphoglycolate phosphatase-like HAD superfamily hydrolase
MKQYLIFDLDLTLVDTTIVEPFRNNRDWDSAYSKLSKCHVYDGLDQVFEVIRKYNIQTCIVSTSPRPYVEKIVKYFNLPINHIVAYHDAKPIKPHQAPMLKALDLFGCAAKDAISFGDRVIDIQSSNAANIESVACFWGTKEKVMLLNSGYNHAIIKPSEILTLIR